MPAVVSPTGIRCGGQAGALVAWRAYLRHLGKLGRSQETGAASFLPAIVNKPLTARNFRVVTLTTPARPDTAPASYPNHAKGSCAQAQPASFVAQHRPQQW
jgi:hypothetical protein